MSDFTDEDVQRGIDSLPEQMDRGLPEHRRWLVRTVLAAVLPAYAKRVRAEALRDAADALELYGGLNDYADPAEWLRARADTEEAGHGHCHCAECPPLGWDCGCARADAEEGKP